MIVDAKAKPGGWLELAKYDLDQKKADADIRASDATAGLRGRQMQMLTDQAAGSAEAQQIRAQYSALTPEEQAGPKGQGLIRDFNMANAKAGMAVPLGAAPRAERPALSEADATARAKAMVEAREVGPDGKRLTFMQALDIVRGTPPAPGTPASDSASLNSLIGSGRDPFVPPAAPARPSAAATAPAPRQTGSAGIDTSRPRTDVNPVTNLPREAPVSAPNLVSAVARGLDAGQARYVAYLEAKIAARERLTPDEAARAKRFGLVP
jgi:hypothetical protein